MCPGTEALRGLLKIGGSRLQPSQPSAMVNPAMNSSSSSSSIVAVAHVIVVTCLESTRTDLYDSNFCFDIWRVTNADYLLILLTCSTAAASSSL